MTRARSAKASERPPRYSIRSPTIASILVANTYMCHLPGNPIITLDVSQHPPPTMNPHQHRQEFLGLIVSERVVEPQRDGPVLITGGSIKILHASHAWACQSSSQHERQVSSHEPSHPFLLIQWLFNPSWAILLSSSPPLTIIEKAIKGDKGLPMPVESHGVTHDMWCHELKEVRIVCHYSRPGPHLRMELLSVEIRCQGKSQYASYRPQPVPWIIP